jgi:two-component sensor histidine kinase/PAS domain-containing protein
MPSVTVLPRQDTEMKRLRSRSHWTERLKRKARKPAFMLAVLLVTVLAIGWGVTLWQIDYGRKEAINAENSKNNSLALTQEERVLRSLQVLDQALLVLRHDHQEKSSTHSLQSHVETMRLDKKYVGVVSILGPTGEVVFSNASALRGNFADREYFKHHSSNSADELLVGKPIIGKLTGKWLVSLTRRITNADGSFGGVIFLAVDPTYFLTFYEAASSGPHSTVALIGADGITRVRNNNGRISYGEDIRSSRLFKELEKSPQGQYVGVAVSDGQTRTVSYRKVADYPLIVLVGSSLNDVIAKQSNREFTYLALAALCSLLITIIGLVVNNSWRRIEDALDRVRSSESRLQSIFDVAPVPLALNNEQLEITHLNQTFVNTFGYNTRDIPMLADWWQVAYPDAQYRDWVIQAWGAEMLRSSSTGTAFKPMELTVRCKDGSDKQVLAEATPMPGSREGEHLVLLYDTTEQAAARAHLNSMVAEKNALLKEVHHRVKNNLQVITSLLRLEGNRASLPAVKATLDEMNWRIRTMALVHESLYRSGSFAEVGLDGYLRQLATEVFRAMLDRGVRVDLQLDLQPVTVSMNMATPCGLIVNELISNALKHGFKDGRQGSVKLSLQPIEAADGKTVRLCVSDNGVGLPVDFQARQESSLGMQLVSDLAQQLGANLTIGPGHLAGFCLEFTSDVVVGSPHE